jgi:hypothetical protein
VADRTPPPNLIAEALRVPGGWVYEIVGEFEPDQAVPPEAIKGAWKVDDDGKLTGEYRANPRFSDYSRKRV